MKWILGLDLRERCGGTLRFAGWLASAAAGESFAPVHVIEQEHLLLLLRHLHLDQVLAETKAAAERAVAAGGGAGRFPEVRVVRGRLPEEALAEAAGAESAGIVVGRIARCETRPLVRLGRVARRLVRHLPAPLVVVPPDLAEVAAGPVVALASLERDALAACGFARDLARRVSRPLAILHVVADPAQAAQYGLPDAAIERYRAEARAEARDALAAWLRAAEVEAASAEVRMGDVVEQALAFAAAQGAALIVTGARRRHSAQRLYAPSVGRELAAAAPAPVAIVPPEAA